MLQSGNKAQQAKPEEKTSIARSGSSSELRKLSPPRSVGGKPPRQSTGKRMAATNDPDANLDFECAVRKTSLKGTGEDQSKTQGITASSGQNIKPEWFTHSFGKRANIISGREPKLPKSLLEGRRSERMMHLKGRGYNEEDWVDDSKSSKKGDEQTKPPIDWK
jgi:hypothetical protein